MTNTVCVLALDAADYDLLKEWDCENLLLDDHQGIETFAWSHDQPYTPEVWATVATGVSPEKHGIGEQRQEMEWDNPVLRLGSHFTQHLPPRYRQKLGRPFRELGAESTFQEISNGVDHPFDDTLSWPGLGKAEHLKAMWQLADDANYGDVPKQRIEATFQSLTGQEIGYLEAMNETDNALVGVHAHILDIAGHLYAERPDELRTWYEWVDAQVGRLAKRCNRLVILSDHGIQTTYLNDDDPGSHSWRPYIAVQGLDGVLPQTVYDVREYLEANSENSTVTTEDVQMDTPEETLKDLGYIQ